MADSITVAWAVPVQTDLLGARLEAHIMSKSSIHVFKLCVKYGQTSGAAVGKLPPELVNTVVGHIYHPIFNEIRAQWSKKQLCVNNSCSPSDHFSRDEIEELHQGCHCGSTQYDTHHDHNCDHGSCNGCYELSEHLHEVMWDEDRHEKSLEFHLDMFDGPAARNDKFNRYRQVWRPAQRTRHSLLKHDLQIFTEEFQLETYFLVLREYNPDIEFPTLEKATVLSYLILPSVKSAIEEETGPGLVSYISSTFIDPAILHTPMDEQKARFKTALRALGLEPYVEKRQISPTCPTSKPWPVIDQPKKDQDVRERKNDVTKSELIPHDI